MNTELTMLIATSGLILLLTLLQGTRNIIVLGLVTAAGNQHTIPAWSGVHDRFNRAIRNQIEGIVIFAPILLAIVMSGQTNDMTALGSQQYFFARAAHALLYITGVPWLRTGAWAVGVAGIVMVASPLAV